MKIYTNDLVKGHSDFKVKCLTFGLYTQVSDSGPLGPLVSKTTEAIVVKFHLKYDQTPGFQNYEFGLGQESKMATVTKNSNTIKINFFSGTIRYNWL